MDDPLTQRGKNPENFNTDQWSITFIIERFPKECTNRENVDYEGQNSAAGEVIAESLLSVRVFFIHVK